MSTSLRNGDGVRRRRSVPRGTVGWLISVAVRKLVAGGFAQRGSPIMIGTRWLGDGMTGKPAPARRLLKQVAYRGKRRRRLSRTRRPGSR